MQHRRDILISALRAAGLAAATPLLSAAAPYVRLDTERDTTHGERRRLAAEVESLYEQQGSVPAARLQIGILAAWANLATYPKGKVAVHDLQARLAILAGSNSITGSDPVGGRRWFELAHRHARMVGDRALMSLAHSRAANAAIYWRTDIRTARTDAELAMRYATTAEQRGMAAAQACRIHALAGDGEAAARSAEEAVAFASVPYAGRIDRWSAGAAHMTVSRALARLPHLGSAAEEHAAEALRILPPTADLWRAHCRLDMAEARVRRRDIGGALGAVDHMIRSCEHLEPVLRQRLAEVATMVEQRTGRRCDEIRRHV